MKESQIFLDARILKIGRKRSPEAWKSFHLYLFIFWNMTYLPKSSNSILQEYKITYHEKSSSNKLFHTKRNSGTFLTDIFSLFFLIFPARSVFVLNMFILRTCLCCLNFIYVNIKCHMFRKCKFFSFIFPLALSVPYSKQGNTM